VKPKIGGSRSRLARAKKQDPHLQIIRAKGLEVWPKWRAPASPAKNPEFKHQYSQKEGKKRRKNVSIIQAP
jgi:hypothetical protein